MPQISHWYKAQNKQIYEKYIYDEKLKQLYLGQ